MKRYTFTKQLEPFIVLKNDYDVLVSDHDLATPFEFPRILVIHGPKTLAEFSMRELLPYHDLDSTVSREDYMFLPFFFPFTVEILTTRLSSTLLPVRATDLALHQHHFKMWLTAILVAARMEVLIEASILTPPVLPLTIRNLSSVHGCACSRIPMWIWPNHYTMQPLDISILAAILVTGTKFIMLGSIYKSLQADL